MNEKTLDTVIEALAETVRNLKLDVLILKGENERLKEQIKKNEEKEKRK